MFSNEVHDVISGAIDAAMKDLPLGPTIVIDRTKGCFPGSARSKTINQILHSIKELGLPEIQQPEPPDVMAHAYQVKCVNPHVKEETFEGPQEDDESEDSDESADAAESQVKYWKVDESFSQHWLDSLATADGEHSKTYNCDPQTVTPSQSCLLSGKRKRDFYETYADANPYVTDEGIIHTTHLMYKLAETMELDPTSEEAEIFNASLEAMGTAEHMVKRLRVRLESGEIDERLERRLAVQSWQSAPHVLWDATQLLQGKQHLAKLMQEHKEQKAKQKASGEDTNAPWWNAEVAALHKAMKKALTKYNKNRNEKNTEALRLAKAALQKEKRRSQRELLFGPSNKSDETSEAEQQMEDLILSKSKHEENTEDNEKHEDNTDDTKHEDTEKLQELSDQSKLSSVWLHK